MTKAQRAPSDAENYDICFPCGDVGRSSFAPCGMELRLIGRCERLPLEGAGDFRLSCTSSFGPFERDERTSPLHAQSKETI